VPDLISHGDDGGFERCVRCGALAAGPCARCGAPTCGDCCVIVEGGARRWAVCLACEDRGGRSLRNPWLSLLVWIVGLLVGLALLVVLVGWLVGA
jgi:hypothetical protein